MVAACVLLRAWEFDARVADSKRLTPRQRERAYAEILLKAYVGVGIIPHTVIDTVRIGRATLLAMESAVAQLGRPVDRLLVDGLWAPAVAIPTTTLVRGEDRSVSIACASIVAKVVRDQLMRDLDRTYPHYGFAAHKGYGTPAHLAALRRFGPSPIHRMSFRPVREAASRAPQAVGG